MGSGNGVVLFEGIATGDLVAISRVGLEFKRDPTMEEWASIGASLGALQRWTPWAIGDWMRRGRELFGEEWSQFVGEDSFESVIGVSGKTARNYELVCEKVPTDERRDTVELGHHEAVLSRFPKSKRDRERWLDKIEEAGLTQSELRRELSAGGEPPELLEVALKRLERVVVYAREHLEPEQMKEFNKALAKAKLIDF